MQLIQSFKIHTHIHFKILNTFIYTYTFKNQLKINNSFFNHRFFFAFLMYKESKCVSPFQKIFLKNRKIKESFKARMASFKKGWDLFCETFLQYDSKKGPVNWYNWFERNLAFIKEFCVHDFGERDWEYYVFICIVLMYPQYSLLVMKLLLVPRIPDCEKRVF